MSSLISRLASLKLITTNVIAVTAVAIVEARGSFDLEVRATDDSRQQTDDDIKNLCTDKGGVALWRPKRGGPSGEAFLDSPGEVQE